MGSRVGHKALNDWPHGKQRVLFPRDEVFCCTSQLKNRTNIYGRHLTTCILKAVVQSLLFAGVSQRFHGIVNGSVSRFRVYVPKKLSNFFFSQSLFESV